MALHEAGETARSFIGNFREQPFLLAMVLMNLAMLGFLYYDGIAHNADRRHQLELLYENRKYVGDLLIKCHLPPPK